ncbi:hypothetical protein L218DRAFT_955206 [Marasmius fiardii PR-910]|nr:hypothetical protein L218DRAFT_955206 [Marasmius fiardii PR-910]
MSISPCSAKHSSRIADSLASVSQSVLSAFSEMETKYQDTVTHITAETSQARTERDNAIRRLHEVQLQAQERKHEIETLEASVKQLENTVTEQAATISQLRKDMNFWKDQARNWQEHFLRVEEARCTLSSRLEEYKERLNNRPKINVAPLTPVSRYADSDEAAKEKHPQPHSCSPEPTTPLHLTRSATQRKKTPMPKTKAIKHDPLSPEREIKQRKSNPVYPTPTATATAAPKAEHPSIVHTRLIRRVHAVMPVKEESESDYEPLDSSPPRSSPPPIQHPTVRYKGRKNAHKRLSAAVYDDSGDPFDDAQEAHHDLQEDEGIEEEEDDELMITSETYLDDHPSTSASASAPSKRTVVTPTTAKKRKRNDVQIRPPTATKRRV